MDKWESLRDELTLRYIHACERGDERSIEMLMSVLFRMDALDGSRTFARYVSTPRERVR